ncbi:methyltransferase domain-containing protein [Leptospira langatensis]|uniref:Methyltransferase domain-containing protein n=1 Tax=Leptospira langatensis TaxID=2484983 RepID=A0A5F1ZX05_9LEPT|nr:methyltransferase domain-containing protein [Leptospira langatensis]TGJ98304.1 methyltransferase domain-containing protein [Leptospira langatensis]TGL43218.1 methyltransferase domain-containing protein [Leptospira langatensis]
MSSPKEHYESFLAKRYSWMLGDLSEKEKEHLSLFQSFGISPKSNSIAWDLGAGSGIQSIPLENLGFDVLAADFSQDLLEEIATRHPSTRIQTKVADIRSSALYQGEAPELLLCMGDTITHLESETEWEDLVRLWSSFLKPGSLLFLSYRDLSYGTPGEKMGFVVRDTGSEIFSCILSFGKEKTEVTDLFHYKNENKWDLAMSSYNKLVLPIDRILQTLSIHKFELQKREEKRGMHFLLLKRI